MRSTSFLLPALVLALTTGCGAFASNDDESEATRKFKADNGTVAVPDDPQRIVATGYAVPELIEAGAPLVGRSAWSRGIELMSADEKRAYDDTEEIAGDLANSIKYEAVEELDPDLIVIGVPLPVLADVDMERLKDIAPTVVLGPQLPDDWKALTERQADVARVLDHYGERKSTYNDEADRLEDKFAPVLGDLQFAHLGGYEDAEQGQFQREFDGAWGTNIAEDIGVDYYGEVSKKTGGSGDVAEVLPIEKLTANFGSADAITYTLAPDGSIPDSVQYVLDSPLWKKLPAVKAGNVFGIEHTQATTYGSALRTLEALDSALAPLLDEKQ